MPANRHSDPFQDANEYGYVATQLSHLPRLNGYDPGNLLSYIPLYGNRMSTNDLITKRRLYEYFFIKLINAHSQLDLILSHWLKEIV